MQVQSVVAPISNTGAHNLKPPEHGRGTGDRCLVTGIFAHHRLRPDLLRDARKPRPISPARKPGAQAMGHPVEPDPVHHHDRRRTTSRRSWPRNRSASDGTPRRSVFHQGGARFIRRRLPKIYCACCT
jgi:hypothetical protein